MKRFTTALILLLTLVVSPLQAVFADERVAAPVDFPSLFGAQSSLANVVDQFAGGIANEAKTGYQSLTIRNATQIAKDQALIANPSSGVSSAAWHFFTSPVTGLGGPSAPLQNALIQAGINTFIH